MYIAVHYYNSVLALVYQFKSIDWKDLHRYRVFFFCCQVKVKCEGVCSSANVVRAAVAGYYTHDSDQFATSGL